MAVDDQIVRVLRLYGDECLPVAASLTATPLVVPVAAAESFSGARLWQITTRQGLLCLRQWPAGNPSVERLEFIQAVLWHVDQEGFRRIPLPLETEHHHGYVWHAGHLWELAPWLPGEASYDAAPNRARLAAALRTLAEFHQAAGSFPLPESQLAGSPGILERRTRLQAFLAGGGETLKVAIRPGLWPELTDRARRTIALVQQATPQVLQQLAGLEVEVPVQPCIRDIRSAHVLFVGDEVTGLVDFGSMRPENVATDVARLLGTMAADDRTGWRHGLAAYQTVRRLSEVELRLVAALDAGAVLLSPVQWLEWIYLEDKQFARPEAVFARFDALLTRLEALAGGGGQDRLA